ncbi:NAD(P)H-dependent oxidoreductase [Bradyrhizobium ontarionense]|uniref:NAD(P)H-dependent oxidoreductase n=1 Tax=Bradyrhizobium ontarionense TaxID=2898149 RepID=A0ABY3RCF0_9BRAD|nr:NAD(P)H-dependent oxidoreductase [Bradyrhizobium sp. A19]UFZ04963.1 NAD(P)H-dependent oxidoreductase [Bradyrhizobium sp. A19]
MRDLLIVGVGGTTRAGSSSEAALRIAMEAAERLGARTQIFAGRAIALPMFTPERSERGADATAFIAALRRADGVIISSPGYHGSISGLIKNALDYTEDMRDDRRPYFDERAVGCIACAAGWQAAGSTLSALRSVIHALRGWPTPFGVGINTSEYMFGEGRRVDPELQRQLSIVGSQVVEFAELRRVHCDAREASM